MYEQTLNNPGGIKVGILAETPFLGASKSVKRAIKLTREALTKAGYKVVDVKFTPKEYSEGRNLMMGMIQNGHFPDLIREWERAGEVLPKSTAEGVFVIKRGSCVKGLIERLLRATNQGRMATFIPMFSSMKPELYEEFMRQRYEFAYAMSQKWQDLGISALITPNFPHCAFKA